jgi:microsomal epoxide hydrolase
MRHKSSGYHDLSDSEAAGPPHVFSEDRTSALKKLDRPTLIVASHASGELQEMREMASQLSAGRIEVVGDAGHALFVDQPERFAKLLDDFLIELPAQP